MSSANIVWLIPGLPLLGFLIHAFAGKRIPRKLDGAIATALVLVSFLISLWVLKDLTGLSGEKRAFASLIPFTDHVPWITIGSFQVYYRALIDPLSLLMCLIVTGVGGLIHLYATGYMADDRDYPRFFTYLNLFIFFMLMLVLGESILLMFVGWEGVGLCSYLLISFWFEDVENSKAGNKAFIMNRVGDVGFALGMMAIFTTFGTFTFYTEDGKGFLDMALRQATASGTLTTAIATTIGLLLFVGACGKSAQFPLYSWLPDAMAGPTPVSALIHAATMVTAGVVMVTRVSPILVQSPFVMGTIAVIGLFTATFAATIALTQQDIKKVLAFSTVSQLGYMFLGCGVGAFTAGMFHVTTHAFFKALLFLGAGSVIHALSGEQDMRKMGGLAKRIPITYWTMVTAWLAISGIFPFAGFWSKDEILGKASGYQTWGILFYVIGVATAFLTAFYMTRLMVKTFWGQERFNEAELGAHGHGGHSAASPTEESTGESAAEPGHEEMPAHGVHESPPSMWIPLAVLAVLSTVGGFIGTPWANKFESFLEPSVKPLPVQEAFSSVAGMAIGFMVGLAGILVALSMYRKHEATGALLTPEQEASNPVFVASQNQWYWDSFLYRLFVTGGDTFAGVWNFIDKYIVDGAVTAIYYTAGIFSELFRQIQTGYVRNYALMMLLGVVAVVGGLLWGAHNLLAR